MAVAWRLVPREYSVPPHHAYSGEGARKSGGRWNDPGTAIVYTSATVSLAVLEILVNAKQKQVLLDFVAVRISFPDADIEVVDPTALVQDWTSFEGSAALREFGTDWVSSRRTPVLSVPSAVIPLERNFLFNSEHSGFAKFKIDPAMTLPIDPRLLQVR
jgi:RES domain-containing protein